MSLHDDITARFALVERQESAMHGYQGEAVQFLWENLFSILLVDLGLGKTISSLTVIARLLWQMILTGNNDKILIIGPVKVIADTWPTEIALWQHTAWMNYTVIRDDEETDPRYKEARQFAKFNGTSVSAAETEVRNQIKAELARSPTQIHLINREQVDWLCNFHGSKWPYRTVFIDESRSFMDHKSGRFKELAKIRNTPGLITRCHLLTAMPAPESYMDLFTQIFLLDRGKRLGKNITAFRNQYFSYNKYSYKYVLRPGAEEEILTLLADIALVMKKEDYLPRAAPTVVQHKVRIAAPQLALMKKLERDFIMTLPDGTVLEAKSAGALANMLMQMASGTVYETAWVEDMDDEDLDLQKVKKVHHIHDHKLDTLKEIVEEAKGTGKPLLVCYYYKASLDKLKKAFPKATVMDKAGSCIKDWNKGKIPLLFIHPMSAGHGLNLQQGGSTMIFYDLIWPLDNYLQVVGRIDRQGQTKPVLIILLVAEGTRDEDCAASLAAKEDRQDQFFAILKRLIREYRKNLAKAATQVVEEF